MKSYAKQLERFRTPPHETSPNPDIILDSGAYSVWRSGANVDLDRYRQYCQAVVDCALTCVNLDVIPGAWGTQATAEDIDRACVESYDRWKMLSDETDALIMPVYHQGDPLEWLDRYVEEGALYIGISPTDSFSAQTRFPWLHTIHEYLWNNGVKLNQEVFTHCLGVFAPSFLYDLPAWSADASTLIRWVVWKRLLLPEYDYRGRITGYQPVPVSKREIDHKPIAWDVVEAYVKSIGIPYEKDGRRVVIDPSEDLIIANLHIAQEANRDTGVRCFVAGQLPLAIYAVTMAHYPYILRSYAVIKERSGETVRKIYRRDAERPARRPEKDRKVAPTRGLFT